MTPMTASPVRSRVKPPDLRNRRKFVRLRNVPVIDVNSRKYRKGDKVDEEHLDEDQLHRICRNSQVRESKGEHGILFLGHTSDGGREVDQPPVVGYIGNYRVGTHNDRPTILADAYIYRDADPSHVLRQFPRRSAEIIGLEEPDGYVDSLSLIKRAPERDLGLITHYALDHDASEGSGSVVRFRSSNPVYRFTCPDRFCSCEEEEGEAMPKMMGGGNKKLAMVAKHLVELILEQVAGGEEEEALGLEEEGMEEEGLEPEGLDEPEMEGEGEFGDEEPSMGDEEGEFEEPSEARFEMEDDPSEMEPSEPERMSSRRPKSRNSLGGSTNGGMGDSKSGPSMNRKSAKPVRLDPEKPSRHSAATSTAGYPSATTTVPSDVVEKKPKMSRHGKDGKPMSRFEKPKPKVSRMVQDSERTRTSRYQREIDDLKATVGELTKAREKDRIAAREAKMERHVIQLESEGFILNRPRVVKRFMKCANKEELQAEIEDIRRFGKQSPVNQPMLPNVWSDVGGGSPDREHELTTRQMAEMDTDDQGIEIVGSGVARFAMKDEKLSSGRPQDVATATVSRFRESRKPSRGQRNVEDN